MRKRKSERQGVEERPAKVGRITAGDDLEADSLVVGDEVGPGQQERGKLKKYRISKASRRVLKLRGITHLFPIQYLTYNPVYEGKDVIGHARTGTGKTLSFVLPLVEQMLSSGKKREGRGRPPVVLVMAPTRELANQVTEVFRALAQELSVFCIYGGVPYEPQESAMRNGLDILVGTPGRILDHMQRMNLDLSHLECVVLDEADQMLERGFAETVEEILAASFTSGSMRKPQMLLFSATVPSWVCQTALRYMTKERVRVDLVGNEDIKTAVTVEHKAICCPYTERPSIIADVIQIYSGAHGRTMIFTNTKLEANELALNAVLKQECQVLHGDILQKQREMTLKSFREGRFPVLVATDVAARGLDIPEVDLVVQCEPPKDVGAYIHRSGRTGRAGRTGTSVMFYKVQQEYLIHQVERKAGIMFQFIGAPQPSDLVKAAGRDALRSIEGVPPTIPPLFHEAAQQLIQEKGAEGAVAAALAFISGFTAVTSRSLLSAQQGFTTLMLACEQEVRSPGYFWKVMEQRFGEEAKSVVKGLRMTQDCKAVVFDLPKNVAAEVKERWQDSRGITLSAPQVLPLLKPRPLEFYHKQSSCHKYGSSGQWNGRRSSGQWTNGHRSNGQWTNGHRSSGQWTNGRCSTGQRSTGHWSNRLKSRTCQ